MLSVRRATGAADDEGLQPSDLDESTHAEMRMLYEESSALIRYAKTQQWRSLSATLLGFAALIVLGDYLANSSTVLVKLIALSSFLLSASAIYILYIFQTWQGTERKKLLRIAGKLSSLFQEVSAIKSSSEANVHRYTLLGFMIGSVLFGNAMVIMALWQYYH